ncbi:hypothetical protein [Streptomyces globisporus]|uniref:hypothetical protein n=1 Tax=Streptomyces globisporus TaxID=1908 RepID=UPI0033D35E86
MTTRDNLDSGLSQRAIEGALRSRADSWQYNEEMEKAAALEENGAQLSSTLRMSLGYYRTGKKAAAAAGRNVSDAEGSEDSGTLSAAYRSPSNPAN